MKVSDLDRHTSDDGSRYPCPCCRNITLRRHSRFRVCPVCLWEDHHARSDSNPHVVQNGFNGVTLAQARANFAAFGACDEKSKPFARPPHPHERPTS
jgi:hypothetical protein